MNNLSLRTLDVEEMEKIEGGELAPGLGTNVMNCVSDAYTNHGWSSLALFVATAFVPEGALLTVAACTGKNYPSPH